MSKKTCNFTGNKGEWSEVYVFFKLLVDGVLMGADKDGEPDPAILMEVLKTIRGHVEASKGDPILIKNSSGKVTVSSRDWAKQAISLFNLIRKAKANKITDPNSEAFLRSIGFTQLTAAATNKRDLTVQVKDATRGTQPLFGFSVKSEIGGAPTLLNATDATNLIFEIVGLSDSDIVYVNAINGGKKIINRCRYIKEKASRIKFIGFNNPCFYENLLGIDDGLPEIVSHFVYAHYFENCHTCEEAVKYLENVNPRKYSNIGLYETKIKRFLRSSALGMKPATPWNDEDDATGGYIIAKPNGSLVAFYIYDRKIFDEYLFKLTKFERGSVTRHKYMTIEKSSNRTFLKLNLQIRFKA
jgi:hypothetical protein